MLNRSTENVSFWQLVQTVSCGYSLSICYLSIDCQSMIANIYTYSTVHWPFTTPNCHTLQIFIYVCTFWRSFLEIRFLMNDLYHDKSWEYIVYLQILHLGNREQQGGWSLWSRSWSPYTCLYRLLSYAHGFMWPIWLWEDVRDCIYFKAVNYCSPKVLPSSC